MDLNSYYKYFRGFWLPIYKKQVFKAKITKDIKLLFAIKENIYKNCNLKKYRKEIVKELGLYHF